ncbi:hypothetical protein STEG23_004309 [Scotinomys teguina]
MEDSRSDLLSTWTVSGSDFLDNEMHLLLAATITSRKMMDIKDIPYGVYILCGKITLWARDCSCLDSSTEFCVNWTCRTHGKVTIELCKVLQIPASQKKLPDILQDTERSD